MNHLTSELMQEYLDGIVNTEMRKNIKIHLAECNYCRDNLNPYQIVDSALQKMRQENTNPQFTHRVIKRLGIKESPSILWSIFKNLAPLLGLLFIISIVYGVLKFAGSLDSSEVGESVVATKLAYDSVATGISTGISAFSGWMKNAFPFLYTKSSYNLTAFLVVLFIIVALLDKFIFMPMVKRKM